MFNLYSPSFHLFRNLPRQYFPHCYWHVRASLAFVLGVYDGCIILSKIFSVDLLDSGPHQVGAIENVLFHSLFEVYSQCGQLFKEEKQIDSGQVCCGALLAALNWKHEGRLISGEELHRGSLEFVSDKLITIELLVIEESFNTGGVIVLLNQLLFHLLFVFVRNWVRIWDFKMLCKHI